MYKFAGNSEIQYLTTKFIQLTTYIFIYYDEVNIACTIFLLDFARFHVAR